MHKDKRGFDRFSGRPGSLGRHYLQKDAYNMCNDENLGKYNA